MTRTGEGILISVPISILLIIFLISQTDWVKESGNPIQLQNSSQVKLAEDDGMQRLR